MVGQKTHRVRRTAVVYLRKRVATVVLYVGRERVSAKVRAREVVVVLRRVKVKAVWKVGKTTVYVVKGSQASLFALVLMKAGERTAWKISDVADFIDRDIARHYDRVFTLRSPEVPAEVYKLWKDRGLGAEVPLETAAKTHPRLLRNFWGTYKLEEYPWLNAIVPVEVVWL